MRIEDRVKQDFSYKMWCSVDTSVVQAESRIVYYFCVILYAYK